MDDDCDIVMIMTRPDYVTSVSVIIYKRGKARIICKYMEGLNDS